MADLSLYQRMPGFDAYRQEGIDRNLQRDLIKAQTERQKQAALTGGGSKPAALQIAERMFALEKIRDNPNESLEARKAAAREYNLIGQAAKTYGFDRGIEYGLGGMGNIGMGGMEMPQQDVTRQVMSNQTQPGQFENLDAIMAEMGTPQTAPPSLPPVFQGMPQVSEVQGWSDIMAEREGKKAGAAERAKLEQQLALEPEIEASKSRSKYTEEGFQSLPKIQRALEARELTEEFLLPKIDSIAQRASAMTTGFGGALLSSIPGTEAFNLKKDVETLLANAGFDRLQQMRDNSPTGGALGQVSNIELGLLQSAAQSLMNSQDKEQFLNNLQAFKQQRARSLQNIRAAYEQDYQRFGGQRDRFLPAPSQKQSAPEQQPQQKIQNGATATNPQTGQRLIFIDGQWRPL